MAPSQVQNAPTEARPAPGVRERRFDHGIFTYSYNHRTLPQRRCAYKMAATPRLASGGDLTHAEKFSCFHVYPAP